MCILVKKQEVIVLQKPIHPGKKFVHFSDLIFLTVKK